MDLGSECSALESVEDNDVIPCDDVNRIETNGTCAIDNGQSSAAENAFHDSDTASLAAMVNDSESGKPVNSPPITGQSSPDPSSPVLKGYGLKKWRRIRRDFVKDLSASEDTGKKRSLSTSDKIKPQPSPLETKQSNEVSVGSATTLKNIVNVDGIAFHGSSSNSRLAVGSAFNHGTDSENSEDRSSKSSTAASAPKARYDLNAVLGYVREKNRIKNISGKSVGSSGQRGQQGKGRVEGSKKLRGERIKVEKENSHSSIESDSRSSCFVFTQGTLPAASNGNRIERSITDDGDNSDEASAGEQQFSEEVETSFRKEDGIEAEDVTQDNLAAGSWEVKEDKDRNLWSSANKDHLDESILSLLSAQHALEKEIQKLSEIGKEGIPSCSVINDADPSDFTCIDPNVNKSSMSTQVDSQNNASALEAPVLSLKRKVKSLEIKLEETLAVLQSKESRVAELEATIITSKSPNEESCDADEIRSERVVEMEKEFDNFYREKIESEIERLAIVRAIEKFKYESSDQTTIIEDQKFLFNEQVQMMNRLGEAETKATTLKIRAEGLKKYCNDALETEEILKTQRKVFKVSSCAFVQSILFILTFCFFILQLRTNEELVVPT